MTAASKISYRCTVSFWVYLHIGYVVDLRWNLFPHAAVMQGCEEWPIIQAGEWSLLQPSDPYTHSFKTLPPIISHYFTPCTDRFFELIYPRIYAVLGAGYQGPEMPQSISVAQPLLIAEPRKPSISDGSVNHPTMHVSLPVPDLIRDPIRESQSQDQDIPQRMVPAQAASPHSVMPVISQHRRNLSQPSNRLWTHEPTFGGGEVAPQHYFDRAFGDTAIGMTICENTGGIWNSHLEACTAYLRSSSQQGPTPVTVHKNPKGDVVVPVSINSVGSGNSGNLKNNTHSLGQTPSRRQTLPNQVTAP
eukprot:Platyproteum_vivax@DN6676_c0_g1_i2.p1